jgi:17beta-estradiol 17-dehydrogenase / very-long-chain 3-oxoacyl-CoA reductase
MVTDTAAVHSNTMHQPVSWISPTADDYAKAVLNSLGCGKQFVIPHFGHAVSGALVNYLPEGRLASLLRSEMKKVVDVHAKWEE